MASKQRYVQWVAAKKCWRFRRRVPDEIRHLIGKREWIETLPARTRAEADRLALPHIAETNQIIQLAEAGNWPPIDDDEIEILARGWWEWFQGEPVKRWVARCNASDPLDPHEWALAGEDDLSRSVRNFLIGPRIWHLKPNAAQAKAEALLTDPGWADRLLRNSDAMARLKRQCRILHHYTLGGFLGEIEDRAASTSKVAEAMYAGELDPRLLADTVTKDGITSQTPPAHTVRPTIGAPVASLEQPLPPATVYSFKELIDGWAAERKHITPKSVYEVEHIAGKLARFLGHEQHALADRLAAAKANELTRERFIAWKEALIGSNLRPGTVKKNLNMMKSVFVYGAENSKIDANPTNGVSYKARRNWKIKRPGYSDLDAQKILLAARHERDPALRWIPWICALQGCRLDEVASAMVRDIEKVGAIFVLAIRLDFRDPDASLKNEGSERRLPLHPALIQEGFLEYIETLPHDGPLFPSIKPDRFGRRAGIATKLIGKWIRKTVGIADPRLAPNHSWRHRFISECREAEIERETRDAMTGHSDGSASRDYGEFYIRTVLYPAIAKLVSPLQKATNL